MRTIQRNIVGAFIFSNDDHILLGKSISGGVYQNAWLVPGGGIDDNESPLQAIQREVIEEVGIDILPYPTTLIDITGTGTSEKTLRETGERVHVDMHFTNFRVDIPLPAHKITIKLEDDFDEAKWIHISRLKSLDFSPPMRESLIYLKILGA